MQYLSNPKTRSQYFITQGVQELKKTYLNEQEVDDTNFNSDQNKSLFKSVVLKDVERHNGSEWYFGERENEATQYIEDVKTGISSNTALLTRLYSMVQELKFSSNSKSMRRKKRRSEYDGEFNFERCMAGESDIFDLKAKVRGKRSIDFYIANNCLADFESSVYESRIREFMAHVCKSVESGYTVRLSIVGINEGVTLDRDYKTTTFINRIKDYHEPLDWHLIANICSIPFFRSFGFANEIVRLDEKKQTAASSLGRTVSSVSEIKKQMKFLNIEQGYFYSVHSNQLTNLTNGESAEYKYKS